MMKSFQKYIEMPNNSPKHAFSNSKAQENVDSSTLKHKSEFCTLREHKPDSLRYQCPEIRLCDPSFSEIFSLNPLISQTNVCNTSISSNLKPHRQLHFPNMPVSVLQHSSDFDRSIPHFNSLNSHVSEKHSKPNVFYLAYPNNNNDEDNMNRSENSQVCINPTYRDPTHDIILPNLISSRSSEDLRDVRFKCSVHGHQFIPSPSATVQKNRKSSPVVVSSSERTHNRSDSKSNPTYSWNNPFDTEIIVNRGRQGTGAETDFIHYELDKRSSNFDSNLQFESGEDLIHEKRQFSKTTKWCHRITMVFICLVIFLCLCYRIIDWFGRYQVMKTLFIYTKTGQKSPIGIWTMEESDNLTELNNLKFNPLPYRLASSGRDDRSNQFTITLCNLNLLRGSALFSLSNGSDIYDAISGAREKEFSLTNASNITPQNLIRVPVSVISRSGHRLEEMLKHSTAFLSFSLIFTSNKFKRLTKNLDMASVRASPSAYPAFQHKDMFVSCYTGKSICTHRNFTALITVYGLCYMMKLQPMVHEIKLLLDAQEFDYLIPHRGVIGFRMWIHANEHEARQSLNPILKNDGEIELKYLNDQDQDGIRVNEIFVGTEFQTIIRVSLEMNLRSRLPLDSTQPCLSKQQCPGSDHSNPNKFLLASNLIQTSPTRQFSSSNQEFLNARIVSATQISKSHLMHSLLALRFPALFNRNANHIRWALRIQQRAFLRLTNQTAFEELKKLVPSYTELQNQASQIAQHLRQLELGLWRDQREILQLTQTESVCSKFVLQYFGALINITENFNHELCQLSENESVHTIANLNCGHSTNTTTPLWDPISSSQVESSWQAGQFMAAQNLKYWADQSFNMSSVNHNSFVSSSSNKFNQDVSEKYPDNSELQVMHLFFTGTALNPQLKDILRKYLRLLSAKRMQMGSRNVVRNTNFQDRSISQALTNNYDSTAGLSSSDKVNFENCSPPIQEHVDVKYQNQLEALGETIAKCLQRLEQFASAIETIVAGNRVIIQSFPEIHNDLWKTPESSLVPLIVQVETTSIGLNSAQLTSMDTVISPISEILGICFGTLGLLIPLLLLADYCFTLKCSLAKSKPTVSKQST